MWLELRWIREVIEKGVFELCDKGRQRTPDFTCLFLVVSEAAVAEIGELFWL